MTQQKEVDPKKEPCISRLNITIVVDIEGNLEAWSSLKGMCRAYKWSYYIVTHKEMPVCMPGGFMIHHLKINYGKTINDGEKV